MTSPSRLQRHTCWRAADSARYSTLYWSGTISTPLWATTGTLTGLLYFTSHLSKHLPSNLLPADFSIIIDMTSVHFQNKRNIHCMSRCKRCVTVRHSVIIAKYFRRLLRPNFPLYNNMSQIKPNTLQNNCHTKFGALAPVIVLAVSRVPTSHIYIPVIPNISQDYVLKNRLQN
jgi:hypothetical protein